jgi:hypothetical protein
MPPRYVRVVPSMTLTDVGWVIAAATLSRWVWMALSISRVRGTMPRAEMARTAAMWPDFAFVLSGGFGAGACSRAEALGI